MKAVTVKGVTWTKEKVIEYLQKRDDFLYKSIVEIFKRQDVDERVDKETARKNGRGFNKGDAKFLTECAQLIIHGHELYDHRKAEARNRIIKYAGQLLIVITEKANQSS